MDKVAGKISFLNEKNLTGCTVEVIKEPGRSHLILVEIEPTKLPFKTIMFYAHWDKQPPMEAKWKEGLGPYTPVEKNGLLYGRGSADDGYGLFSAILAVKACQQHKIPLHRIIMTFESSEESTAGTFPV